MKVHSLKTVAFILIAGMSLSAGSAQAKAPWRTPPIKNTSNTQVVSCDLLNASGQSISASNLIIRVRTLEDTGSSLVVSTPGPFTINDGRGIRGSSPSGLTSLQFRTVYCELDSASIIPTGDENLLFSMTYDDGTGRKAVTWAKPRTATQLQP
jgi:hypothetical protein